MIRFCFRLGAASERGHDGRRAAARFFYRRELPRTGPWLELIAARERVVLETEPGWL